MSEGNIIALGVVLLAAVIFGAGYAQHTENMYALKNICEAQNEQ